MDVRPVVRRDVASVKKITLHVVQNASVLVVATCQGESVQGRPMLSRKTWTVSESEDDLMEDIDDVMNNAFGTSTYYSESDGGEPDDTSAC